jgi:hypothetical protein
MLGLMAALKDKADWDQKVFNDEIVAHWRKEALESEPDHKRDSKTASEKAQADPWIGSRRNGVNILFDGEARQKTIDEQLFDYVSTPFPFHSHRTHLAGAHIPGNPFKQNGRKVCTIVRNVICSWGCVHSPHLDGLNPLFEICNNS